ncbi:MAG TPA: hypothetical protein VFC53_00310 [Dehalococcoidia bacterium]|nr:hypothetical protein [Dehalococcoidia bacterium]
MSEPVDIRQFLREWGLEAPEAQRAGRAALEAAGLTRPGKQAFAAEKLVRARAALERSLLRACAGCAPLAPRDDRVVVPAAQTACQVCGGSNNRRAALRCAARLRARKITRVLIVGGTPVQQRDVRTLFEGSGIELKFVDGTQASHGAKEAELNMRWARLVVVWAPTPLRHSVSDRYTAAPYRELKVVTVSRRGIEALCDEMLRAAG